MRAWARASLCYGGVSLSRSPAKHFAADTQSTSTHCVQVEMVRTRKYVITFFGQFPRFFRLLFINAIKIEKLFAGKNTAIRQCVCLEFGCATNLLRRKNFVFVYCTYGEEKWPINNYIIGFDAKKKCAHTNTHSPFIRRAFWVNRQLMAHNHEKDTRNFHETSSKWIWIRLKQNAKYKTLGDRTTGTSAKQRTEKKCTWKKGGIRRWRWWKKESEE